MILRRLAHNLKQQNWTAIWIEFVLLVAGVFLGIQVANWNQALADERLGRAYAQRLAADLEHDLASRRELVAYYAEVLASIERTNDLLPDPRSDPIAVVVSAYRASEYNYRAPSRATWDGIVSSGHTELLAPDVAVSVADYFSYDSANSASRDTLSQSPYRHRVRALIPLDVQKHLRAECSDIRNASQDVTGFKADCSLEVEPEVLSQTASALRADAAVAATLRYQYSDVYSALANIKGDIIAIERALAALKVSRTSHGDSP